VHGAVVAVVEIVDVVTKREAEVFAPWFFGPYGFVLANIITSDDRTLSGVTRRAHARLEPAR